MRQLKDVNPMKLVKHSLSLELYGDAATDGFDESIKRRGIDEPIVVAADGKTIVSGVRRRNGANKASLKTVPVIVRTDLTDDLDIREAIVEANRHNEKSAETKAREYKVLKEIEGERANRRQKLSKGRGKKGPENFPDLLGDARDIAAEQVGMSGKTADKAADVVDAIDDAEAEGDTERAADLRETLNNKSVDAAHKKAKGQKTPKPVTDQADRPVPASLLVTFQNRSGFNSLSRSISAIQKGAESLIAKAGGERLNMSAVKTAVKDLRSAITVASPYAVCPYCKGKGCKQCDELGWIHKDRWDGIPKERR